MAEQHTSAAATSDANVPQQAAAPATGSAAQNVEPLPEDGNILADESDDDSAFGGGAQSGSTSLRSSIIAGMIENGRKYQAQKDIDINIPSDDKQFESMKAAHIADVILECQQENPYFRSPISKNAQHILDLGTGSADWPVAVADAFPNITVHGVDLYPPPANWVPPNCILEVDDFTKPWTWDHPFDLVHIKRMSGTLPTEEWNKLYKRAYENLAPGGWIEHMDVATGFSCDDGSLPKDSLLAKFDEDLAPVVAQIGNTVRITDLMRKGIEDAGFINVQDKHFKFPIGNWPRHPVYKDAGAVNKIMFKEGFEGFIMYLLTKFGLPQPWSQDEVTVYVAKMCEEMDQNYHIYQWCRRVWAQKPFDELKKAQQPEVENVEATPA